ncbi:MAG: HAMP domain-containing histidine kinase [Phycisphaerales bacterium]|nr:HAMP domain-containing histidine kinase [Phycisphaerales bacterium]
MSLRFKFGILLGVIALAVALAVSASWWAFSTVQSEIHGPFRGMTLVLASLGRVKENVEIMRHEASPQDPGLGQPRSAALAAASEAGEAELARVAGDADVVQEWTLRAGRTALTNLRQRLSEATKGVREAARVHRPLSERELQELGEVHELIERLESKIVAETTRALDFSDALRGRLLFVLGCALAIVILTAALGIALVRRWVLAPVAQLRVAAASIARGEFSYRIPVLDRAPRADELAQLSNEVNQMAGMIKTMQDDRVDRERLAAVGEMVRRLAHNLRNPLGGIRGLAELSRSELRPGEPVAMNAVGELRENQDRIISSVDRFESWLNDLMNVTRPAEVHPQSTDLGKWLRGLVAAHEPVAQTRGVFLKLTIEEGLGMASIDARHMEHAVSAILSNAIDAAGNPDARKVCPAPIVRVEAYRVEETEMGRGAGLWRISITDTGLGVPIELKERIFQPYFTTKRDGNGIGLAIAQQVVKAHFGRIHVDSPPSAANGVRNTPEGAVLGASAGGTRFTIELPVNRPALADEPERELARIGQIGARSGQPPRH